MLLAAGVAGLNFFYKKSSNAPVVKEKPEHIKQNAPIVNWSICKMLKCSYDVCYALNTEHLGPKQPEHLRFFLLMHIFADFSERRLVFFAIFPVVQGRY